MRRSEQSLLVFSTLSARQQPENTRLTEHGRERPRSEAEGSRQRLELHRSREAPRGKNKLPAFYRTNTRFPPNPHRHQAFRSAPFIMALCTCHVTNSTFSTEGVWMGGAGGGHQRERLHVYWNRQKRRRSGSCWISFLSFFLNTVNCSAAAAQPHVSGWTFALSNFSSRLEKETTATASFLSVLTEVKVDIQQREEKWCLASLCVAHVDIYSRPKHKALSYNRGRELKRSILTFRGVGEKTNLTVNLHLQVLVTSNVLNPSNVISVQRSDIWINVTFCFVSFVLWWFLESEKFVQIPPEN